MPADARRRTLAGPRPPAVYPCGIAERADERRQQDEAARPWLAAEADLDESDQQLCDEEAAEVRRVGAWGDDLTYDELRELHQQAMAAGAGGDLRAELGQYLARTRQPPHRTSRTWSTWSDALPPRDPAGRPGQQHGRHGRDAARGPRHAWEMSPSTDPLPVDPVLFEAIVGGLDDGLLAAPEEPRP
ncbi:hypothetical protein GCM10010294_68850 [Streptomyces griseoloalbus]|uniref:hypothetical protein n=1 Tax=Streptomyces griseoloalbus TaxID=67303 RepID=UPI0018760AB8|nr:hypothetical protein GCM10010294_68850 [Streptomyces griseoloalbus]